MLAARWIQTLGLILAVGTFAGGEAAAHLLAAWPASPTLWWVNNEVFGFFRYAQHPSSPLRYLFAPPSLWLALAIVACIVAGHIRRQRLLLASLTNVAFTLAMSLGYSVIQAAPAEYRTASLSGGGMSVGWNGLAVATIVVTMTIAFAVSHWTYWTAVFDRRRPGGGPAESACG
jgi:hypothetical protein